MWLRWIVASSLRFRFIVLAGAVALLVVGVGQLRGMPVDVFPEFAPPRVEVQTPALGLSSAEVEAYVTVPLEEALNGVQGLDVIRSNSVSQLSSIELLFKPGTDLLKARQLVHERLETIASELPSWSAPPFMRPPLSSTSRVMKIGLSSDKVSLIHMSTTAYWKIRARLLRVPGVANVAIWGERLQQLHVQVDPKELRRREVPLISLMEVTADALDAGILQFSEGAVIGTGGFVDSPNQRLGVRHVPPIITPQDLAQISLAERNGRTLRLGDVARVVETHMPLIGDAIINDGPGLMLVVEKVPWANTLDVTRGVEAALDELRPGLADIDMDPTIFRAASFVETAIDNLRHSLVLGALLMVLMLFIFLWEWRVALISAIAIPLSVVAAGLVLNARGATINVMVLAGLVIALGDIVDDAIIDVENVVRRLRQRGSEGGTRSVARTILGASLEVRSAIVYATLLEVVAVTPVFFLTGLSGAFFRPLAISYALALIVSMVVALTVTPALSLIFLRKAARESRPSPVIAPLQRAYEAGLRRIVGRPRVAFTAVGVIAIAGAAVWPFLGQDLLPAFKERDFLSHWLTTPGTSLPEESRITVQAGRELRAVPGVRNFGAHIGQALLADEVVGVNFGENWFSVDPKADYDATLASVQKVVDGYPGVHRDVQTYLKERIKEVLTGGTQSVVVRLFGPDLHVLRTKANEIKGILKTIPGVVEEQVALDVDIPQAEVRVDLERARRFGVKPGDVRRAVSALIASEEVGDIYRDGKTYDVHVWSTPSARANLTDVRDLLLDSPHGPVRLADVADIRIRPTPNVIHREGASRTIDVGANVRGRDLGSVVADVRAGLDKVSFPLEHHADLLGEHAERQAAQRRLLVLAVAAAVVVFLLLKASFDSWRLAALQFATLPMALVGGVLAAFGTGGVLSLGSLVGLFTVLGIVARNGIMLISHYQHLERNEGETFGPGLVLRGARERLVPIVMTVLTSGLALVPLVVKGSIPGQEIEYPMAIVILGGLVTATLLNLFVVPSLYLRWGRRGAPR